MSCRLIPGIDASVVDGFELDPLVNRRAARVSIGRDISSGELCCSIVHLDAYKFFLETAAEWVLILEDDAKLIQDPSKIISGLPTISAPTILKLSKPGIEQSFRTVSSSDENKVSVRGFRRLRFPTDEAHSYMMNRSAARLVVQRSSRNKVHYTADWPYLWDAAVEFWQSESTFFEQSGSSLIDCNPERAELIRNNAQRPGKAERMVRALRDISGLNSIWLFFLGGNGFIYYKSRSIRRIQGWAIRIRDFIFQKSGSNFQG